MELHKKIMALEGWPEELHDCVCLHTNTSQGCVTYRLHFLILCAPALGILNSELQNKKMKIFHSQVIF